MEIKRNIRTFVKREDVQYIVSTIDHEGSAAAAYGECYAETIVFRGERILWQGDGSVGSLKTHFAVVQRLYETGNPEEQQQGEGK